MRFLRDIPLKRKLTIISMLASCTALLLACLGFVVHEQIVYRNSMLDELKTTARMLGDNSSAALSFNEPSSAEQTLKSLATHVQISAACIYDKEGKVFAKYERVASSSKSFPPVAQAGFMFHDDRLEIFHEIDLSGEVVGTVYIRRSLHDLDVRLRRYAVIVVVVMAVSSLVAFLLSMKLQAVISRPISQLVRIAGTVAVEKDYSVRAVKEGQDELGRLIDGFNEMLAQIQARDVELQRAQELLEKRVEARTHELQQEVSERKRSEKAMRESNNRFQIVTRATADIIWDWNTQENTLWWSENFFLLFGYSPDEAGNQIDSWTSRIHPDDLARVSATLDEFIAGSSQIWSSEYRLLRKDGTYAFVFDRGYAIRDAGGKVVRMIGAMQDVTKRKEDEARLEDAHRQLVETSRQAGMAEVATGVLHNVGNVLNSVNVSATLVADGLKKSKAANLGKLVTLIKEHQADLGTFLTSDPKGRQVPGYLLQLSDHLLREQDTAVREMEQLRKNIEHIKDIVAMQQSYAKVSGLTESVNVAELVEDSLQINAGALSRHQVEVIRDFSEVPSVVVEKHKVLQILVNLVRNAKFACDESGRTDKRVTVRLNHSEDRVIVSVIDNGVGIPPENLTRIFAHGFTTRRDGHGFGLHSGALAAKEMGGALRVESEGHGLGAKFSLELPVKPQAQSQARAA